MKYWLDLFTWTTWQEFLSRGANISGFSDRRWNIVKKIKHGDMLICYLTGISRFFALLEVTGSPYRDETPLWSEAPFPCRVPVKLLLELSPEMAVPVQTLKDDLSYFQSAKSPHSWTGHFRGSPTEETLNDAQVIIKSLYAALESPVAREFDRRKLERKVHVYQTKSGSVTIPDVDEIQNGTSENNITDITHDEIQWLLLDMGSQMGFDVWVARNDKNRAYGDNIFQNIPHLLTSLPTQFDEATNRTIELIDVLWLKGKAIIAAFEVEHTTQIYSGLLRMSDLISMQPNLNIRLYIVAPDEKRDKVFTQINRPTFSRLEPPLNEICQYISYSSLKDNLNRATPFLRHLSPDFLDDIAEPFESEI